MSKEAYHFATYTYGELDSAFGDEKSLNKNILFGDTLGEWTFMYFGFNWRAKKAYAYIKFMKGVDSTPFLELNHYVPNHLWYYLGSDKIYPQFEGTLANWNLHLGTGSYT